MKNLPLLGSAFILLLLLCSAQTILAQCNPGENLYTYCYQNGEVNTTAFEICPDAGNTASATIIQGFFESGFD